MIEGNRLRRGRSYPNGSAYQDTFGSILWLYWVELPTILGQLHIDIYLCEPFGIVGTTDCKAASLRSVFVLSYMVGNTLAICNFQCFDGTGLLMIPLRSVFLATSLKKLVDGIPGR